jgi:polysaccharide biosynthesis transport protein
MMMERDGSPSASQGTVDLRDFLTKVMRHKGLMALIVVGVVALVMVYSFVRPRVYSSTAEVLVRPVLVPPLASNPLDALTMATEKELVTSTEVAQKAQGTIGGSIKDLIAAVSVSNPTGTQILDITYSAGDPNTAQKGAETFANAYLGFKSDQAIGTIGSYSSSIQDHIATLDQQISSLDDSIGATTSGSADYQSLTHQRDALEAERLTLQNELASVSTLSVDPGLIVQDAQREPKPVSPKHKLDLALGLLLGLSIALFAAYMRENFRDRIQGPQRVAKELEAPVLGLVPDARRIRVGSHPLVTMDDPHGLPAEAYRTVRTNLLALCRDAKARSVLVTSARRGEGKTTTAANLAVAFAQAGRSVLLVSADFRDPRIHTFFGSPNERGLVQLLMGKLSLDDAVVDTELPGLQLLPSGSAIGVDEPVELLQSERMGEVVRGTDPWDFILVDSPPVFSVADSLVLADLVDGVVFVTDAQSSRQASVGQARQQITNVGGRILGGVLNRVPSSWSINGYGADPGWRALADRYLRVDRSASNDRSATEETSGKPRSWTGV